ncbi:13391_t:CDS:1 [Ambispora gerdemannii]|uniref:13391_t:CDS:1 n=1 Tax=Ambispora gerdemannii TaxID=144530 RepID=A0A9N9AE11_9GLOM|nr:13391_t:CDS:1 [Ambispora gerdemannii]
MTSENTHSSESSPHNNAISTSRLFWTAFLLLTSSLYLYVAIKDYQNWRRLRDAFFTKNKKNATNSQKIIPQQQNPLVFVPFIPFAFVYLLLRLAWDAFRLFVFYSLDSAEAGVYYLIDFIKWGATTMPKFVSAVRSGFCSHIKTPFLRFANASIDWMQVYVWPVIKHYSIVTYRISVDAAEKGKALAKDFYESSVELSKVGWREVGYPICMFLVRLFDALVVEPVDWIIPRAIYLQRIMWHCACFLARDLSEDFRDLCVFTWKIATTAWINILEPTALFVEKLITASYQKAISNGKLLAIFLYEQLILAGICEVTWFFLGILQDPIIRSTVKKVYLFIYEGTILSRIKQKIDILIPEIGENVRRSILGTIEGISRTCVDVYILSVCAKDIVAPILHAIPIIHADLKRIFTSAYYLVRRTLTETLQSLWAVFAPLIRPVITLLGIFYTTVILVAILVAIRTVKAIFAWSVIALAYLWHRSEIISGMISSTLILFCQSIRPYLTTFTNTLTKVSTSVFASLSEAWALYFPYVIENVTKFLAVQIQAIRAFGYEAYARYLPLMIDFKERVVLAADQAVVMIGQTMMEWTKKEKELRVSIYMNNVNYVNSDSN